MKFIRRQNSAQVSDGTAGWSGPPPLAERSCCCPARPVVRVLIRPAGQRRLPADLLLCGHHYLVSKAALAAVGAAVIDEAGSVVTPQAANEVMVDVASGLLAELPDPQATIIEVFP